MRNVLLAIGMAVALASIVGCLPPPKPAAKGNADPATSGATPNESTETEQVKAGVGVGQKGRSLDQHEGFVVTPVKALFAAKERISFEIEVPHALALYNATEGQGPQSHAEFMEKIIDANLIKLPLLPPGHEYLYDPMTQQLMVKRPVASQPAQPPQ